MILRPYQERAIDELRDGFRAGHKRQILSAATGSGKSIVMLAMIKKALDKAENAEKPQRTIFICERTNLVDQFSEHLDRAGIDHGIHMSKHWRYRPDHLVQVASAQTLERLETWPAFSIAFIDEVHCFRASAMKMIEARPNLRVIGATATPFNPMLAKYFTNVVSAPSMSELVEMGSLVPFRTFVAHEINVEGVKIVAGDFKKDELEERGRQITGDIVTDYIKLSNDVFGRKSKAICFSCGIAHGAELVQAFAEVGVNAVQLASGVDKEFRKEVFVEFSKADSSIDMLISVSMLSRGFDQTDIEHVILARPLKKSFSDHVQMIGRGARSHTGKSMCLVQDHCNNSVRFADYWDEFYHNGATSLVSKADAKPKKEPTKEQKEAAKCPKCGVLWPRQSDTCLHCGHVRVRMNEVTAVPGEMFELATGTKNGKAKQKTFSVEYKQEFYSGLLYIQASRQHYKPTWAFANFCDKFGHEPRGYLGVASPPNQDVQNWDIYKRMKFAKRKK